MSRPKLLDIFVPSPNEVLYTKTPSFVTVVQEDANLVVQENITSAQEGSSISLITPCSCESITGIKINGTVYEILEANGLAPSKAFTTGALITLNLDVDNSKAYIQNSANTGGGSTDDTSACNVFVKAEAAVV